MSRIIISKNEKRNMAQVVYHNIDNNGKKFSITRHEALNSDRPVNPQKRKKARVSDASEKE